MKIPEQDLIGYLHTLYRVNIPATVKRLVDELAFIVPVWVESTVWVERIHRSLSDGCQREVEDEPFDFGSTREAADIPKLSQPRKEHTCRENVSRYAQSFKFHNSFMFSNLRN